MILECVMAATDLVLLGYEPMHFRSGCPVPRTIPLPPLPANFYEMKGNYLQNIFIW
jgi:hypothetical protein